MLDPQICNVACDANAVDCDGSERDSLVDRFRALASMGRLSVVVPGGVREEVQHPRTPAEVKDAVLPRIFNLRPGLIDSQRDGRRRVAAVLHGNAQPGKHAADASHLSGAAEMSCAYLITHDKWILAKREERRRELPPSLSIVTLAEFFEVFDRFEAERPR